MNSLLKKFQESTENKTYNNSITENVHIKDVLIFELLFLF